MIKPILSIIRAFTRREEMFNGSKIQICLTEKPGKASNKSDLSNNVVFFLPNVNGSLDVDVRMHNDSNFLLLKKFGRL